MVAPAAYNAGPGRVTRWLPLLGSSALAPFIYPLF